MNKWISRIAIAFSAFVIIGGALLWLNKNYFVRGFLEGMYAQKVSIFEQYPLREGDVVMLGDSITDGGHWHEMFPAQAIKNRGIGGDTTTGVLARLESIVKSKPSAVFLKIGTNDLTHGPERSVSYSQYREIVGRIQKESPETDIYLQTLLPRASKLRDEVEAFNREIQNIASESGATYIELYPPFLADDGSIRDELTGDELHLNGDGYRLWQSLLAPYMSRY